MLFYCCSWVLYGRGLYINLFSWSIALGAPHMAGWVGMQAML